MLNFALNLWGTDNREIEQTVQAANLGHALEIANRLCFTCAHDFGGEWFVMAAQDERLFLEDACGRVCLSLEETHPGSEEGIRGG